MGLSRYGEPPSGTERSSEDCTVEDPTSAGVFTERLIAEWGKNALGPVYALYMVLKCKNVSLSASSSFVLWNDCHISFHSYYLSYGLNWLAEYAPPKEPMY